LRVRVEGLSILLEVVIECGCGARFRRGLQLDLLGHGREVVCPKCESSYIIKLVAKRK